MICVCTTQPCLNVKGVGKGRYITLMFSASEALFVEYCLMHVSCNDVFTREDPANDPSEFILLVLQRLKKKMQERSLKRKQQQMSARNKTCRAARTAKMLLRKVARKQLPLRNRVPCVLLCTVLF